MGAIAGATISAGAGLFSSSQAAGASKSAGKVQAYMAMQAMEMQKEMWRQQQAQQKPFIDLGVGAANQIQSLTGTGEGGNPLTAALTRQFQPTMEELEGTPGYQFALDQGMKGVQNGYAAKGLASSGAAMKGGADYATGLASTTYQQQLQNFMQQNAQTFNMLLGQTQVGANVATQQGNQAIAAGNAMSGNMTGAGTAVAAGMVNGANTMASGINSATNSALGWLQQSPYFSNLGGQGGTGILGNMPAAANNNYFAPGYSNNNAFGGPR